MTMFDNRTRLSGDVVKEVVRVFPNKVFSSIIPRSIRLAEAPSYGMPIIYYDENSIGAEVYKALAKEVISHE